MTLCSTDSKGRVLKDSFFPFSFDNNNKGSSTFDVLASSSSSDNNNNTLMLLEEGDEIAYKKGKVQLKYISEDEEEGTSTTTTTTAAPVDSVTVITSGLGVAPTLQIVSRILTDPESAVESIDVLWINESKEQFFLNESVEELEDRFADKLFVARVVDRQFGDRDSAINEKLRDALVRYRVGGLAMVIATEELQAKSCELLLSLGYPLATSVVSVTVE